MRFTQQYNTHGWPAPQHQELPSILQGDKRYHGACVVVVYYEIAEVLGEGTWECGG